MILHLSFMSVLGKASKEQVYECLDRQATIKRSQRGVTPKILRQPNLFPSWIVSSLEQGVAVDVGPLDFAEPFTE